MKRLIAFVSVFFFWSLSLMAENSKDRVLLEIDGNRIYLSEFDYFYRNLSEYRKCSVEEYFDSFLKFKIKAFDARRRGLGQDLEFRRELDTLKKELAVSELCSTANAESGKNVVVQVLTYRLHINDDPSYGMGYMNDVYSKLVSGVMLDEVCSGKCNHDISLELFDDMMYLLEEVRTELNSVPKGAFTKPFLSPLGVHIARMTTSETCDDIIYTYLSDVLLVARWDDSNISIRKNLSDRELEHFFKSNRDRYVWEYPHYKGAVIHCKSRKSASSIKRKLRKLPMDKWAGRLKELKEKDGKYDAVVEVGLFSIGENEYIDKLSFKCGDFESVKEYPYTFIMGKCLDYKPDSYKDVYEELVNDYVWQCEKSYFDDLERILGVEKYIDVLKTVNSDGSN